jgi:hypothetical protein
MIVCANIDYHKIRASRNSPDFEIVNKKLGPCTCRFPQEFGYTCINLLELWIFLKLISLIQDSKTSI